LVLRVTADLQLPDDTPPTAGDPAAAEAAVAVVYWRPGCPFCAMLRAGLRLHRVPFREVNIWDDPDAAAFVRSVARGNETVPTVTVGAVSLVNPSARDVAALIAAPPS
jgi:glutaredoxin-like protein